MTGWQTRLRRGQPEPGLHPWLTVPDSLTRRLQAAGRFSLQVVRQGRGPSHLAGWQTHPAKVGVREVLLCLDGEPVIFAHTELSTAGRGVLGRWLARLGGRSLGSLLFTHPGFSRSAIEYCRLPARHPLCRRVAAVLAVDGPLWARRSWHRLGGEQVLVSEVFLPRLANWPAGR